MEYIAKYEVKCRVGIVNLSDEMFNDGLYFSELINKTTNEYEKWRYMRTALMNFCASAEAWISKMIKVNLNDRLSALTADELNLLEYLIGINSSMPRGFSVIRKKLYEFYPKSIKSGWTIPDCSNMCFEKYLELCKMRNAIVHYAGKDFIDVYGMKLEQSVKDAPGIIEELFTQYYKLDNSQKVPSWFSQKYSRVINC